MKAEHSVQLALLDLQAHDSSLAQLDHKQRNLPDHAQIVDVEATLVDLNDRRVRAETQVGDLERARKKAEHEVELVRTRRERNEERLNSGAVTSPKDLASMQQEIVALDRRIGTLEDEELEVMESLETLQREANGVYGSLEAAEGQRDELVARRDEQIAEFDAKRQEIRIDREDLAPRIPEDLMKLYLRLQDQHSGLAVAAMERRRCNGCHLELTGADLRDLAATPEDDVVRCPECSRILVRTNSSGL